MAPGLSSFFLSSILEIHVSQRWLCTSTCSTSSNLLNDPEEDDQPDSENGVKTFVPLKKKETICQRSCW
jgi:hypothetical protein